jgi:hypothetical protein
MIKEKQKQPKLAGRALGADRHICAFFHSKAEAYDVLGSFIREGFEREEKAVHIIDPARKIEHCRCLEEMGVELPEVLRSGRLDILGWDDALLREGGLDTKRMLALVEDTLQKSASQGFGATRIICDMDWSLETAAGSAGILEYEARLNNLVPKNRDTVICAYDLSVFGAAVAMDALRAHPMALIGGILQVNPFFVPPEEFLDQPGGEE